MMTKVSISWIRTTAAVLGMIAAAFLVASASMPWIAGVIESARNNPLAYESYLRIDLFLTGAILAAGTLLALLQWGRRIHFIIWCIFFVSWLGAGVVFFGDTQHLLMEEYSWIRSTTSAFLFCAALAAGIFSRIVWKQGPRSVGLFWAAGSGALLYAGLDEIFQIHEALTRIMENRFSLPHASGDMLTLGYAVVILAVFLFNARFIFQEYALRHARSTVLCIVGSVLYGISTLFDTFDIFFFAKIQSLANVLSQQSGFAFGDLWYPIWAPKLFFNGVEEVFEYAAATLFFAGIALLLVEKFFGNDDRPLLSKRWSTVPLAGAAVITLGIAGMIVASFSSLWITSPIMSTYQQPLLRAGYFDGLKHADDLFAHPAWGILVANEGGSSVYQWREGQWKKLPDPDHLLRDVDSLTASADAVYVSDGSQKSIFKFTAKNGYQRIRSQADGLLHPEALVIVDGALYVIDQEKEIVRFAGTSLPERWKPEHKDWISPEGSAVAPQKTLLITDDTSGAIFEATFKKSVSLLGRVAAAEDIQVHADGTLIVSDNGWGRVVSMRGGDTPRTLVTFHRSYRDVQGVATDETGSLFVVTADGHDSMSFMPSLFFEIKDTVL